jgi:hypothetical protein
MLTMSRCNLCPGDRRRSRDARDSVVLEVYVPVWRSEVAKLSPALDSATIYSLPDILGRLAEIAAGIPDSPGTLLTREQRTGRAAQIVAQALTLTLLDHGWKLHLQPGQSYVESENGSQMNPGKMVEAIRKNSRKADMWVEYCQKNDIEN